MRALSTRNHAFVHYLLAIFVLSAPWWGRFAGANPESRVALGIGTVLLLYGLVTDNELGVVKRLQMTLHLWLDALAGILLASAPWVFGFDQRVWAPHLAAGLLLLVIAALSHTIPGYERRGARSVAD